MNKDKKQLSIEILSRYGIHTSDITLLRETEYNTVYLVHQAHAKVLRVGYRLRSEDVQFELDLIAFLNTVQVPVAMWHRTTDGAAFVFEPNVYTAVLFDYIEGFHPSADKEFLPSHEQVCTGGKALALIHNAGKTFTTNMQRKRTIHSEIERALSAEHIFHEQYEGGKEFISAVQSLLLFSQCYQFSPTIVHNDYRVHNVFFSSNAHINAVIDFDWSCMGPAIKDVAHATLEWSFPDGRAEPDMALFEAFLSGYNSVAHDVVAYDQNFIDWVKFSALSDTATYFCDRLHTETLEKNISRSYMYKKFCYFNTRGKIR